MMLADVTAIPTAVGPGDLCPAVPVACVLKAGGEAVDAANPFKTFWDTFFVASPSESLQSALQLVWSVPTPNFNADWFRDVYQNSLMVLGIGSVLIVLALQLLLALRPMGSIAEVPGAFKDFLVSFLMMMFFPVASGLILFINAWGIKMLIGISDIGDPEKFVNSFVSDDFFTVGWMSLAARIVGAMLMVEVIILYLVQIFATAAGTITIPTRVIGDAGREWFVKTIRGMLYGFAPLIMTVVIVLFSIIIRGAEKAGSQEVYQFIGVLLALVLAGITPLKLSKVSRGVVTAGALRLAENSFPNIRDERSARASGAVVRHEQYNMRKAERRQERRDFVSDVANAGLAAFSGGASAIAMTGMSAKSNRGRNITRKLNRMTNARNTVDKIRNRREPEQ